MNPIHNVGTTTNQRTARRSAAHLRALGLNASATKTSTPDAWAVVINYAESMTMDEYLARLDILELIVDDMYRRLGY